MLTPLCLELGLGGLHPPMRPAKAQSEMTTWALLPTGSTPVAEVKGVSCSESWVSCPLRRRASVDILYIYIQYLEPPRESSNKCLTG